MRFLDSSPEGMEDRPSPSGGFVRSPGHASRIHSIEAILGFKDENIFHQPISSNVPARFTKDTERRRKCKVPPPLKGHESEGFQSK